MRKYIRFGIDIKYFTQENGRIIGYSEWKNSKLRIEYKLL